ncbi:SMI1/KNR4 family protein [Gallaecimonas xiamenensis]|uniref:Cell wall assembly/cell proliferation coordinating protein, KNR4 n=1 Tax=Gallaecimonas xiamenensis 3-C-1 TaxID=745411 RepID=K2JQP3_9GAMM|nr:SMI1/KNR4 family protein [Gallaecimonas xiamenensis]EKE67535.1 cell wall assembly/cell proliferation coordinating protein, KNR4 [Gallaecimonas xiamenensis 3-C-1]
MRDVSELNIYYQNKVVEKPVPSDSDILSFEKKYGVKLPEDYVSFIQTVNGGAPSLNLYVDDDMEFDVEAFYFLSLEADEEDYYSVIAASQWPTESIGRTVIAIAGDGSGDQLIFDLSLGQEVRLWRHDEEEEPEIIAASFSDFLSKLVEED